MDTPGLPDGKQRLLVACYQENVDAKPSCRSKPSFEKVITESRKIKRKTKPNVKSEHIMKVSLTSFHILYLGWLMWYNVCKSCVFTVTCLSKQSRNRYLICLYNHDLTIAAPNNLFLLKLLFQVIKNSKALNRRCTIWIGPTSHGILSSVIFPHHYPASLRGTGLQVLHGKMWLVGFADQWLGVAHKDEVQPAS